VRVKQRTDARVTPRVITEKTVKRDNEVLRKISVKQLSILLYHFYIGLVQKQDIGFPDAETSALKFQAELNQEVTISTEHLEKLLFALEYANELGLYWSPANEDMDYFVKGLLEKNEKFDKLSCLLLNKKKGL
jgi:hypothetical protein